MGNRPSSPPVAKPRVAAHAPGPVPAHGGRANFLRAWEDPDIAEYLRTAILTAAHEPVALQQLATNFALYILQAVSSRLSDQERLKRASLASPQMVGLATTRYVWRVGTIAQMPAEDVVTYRATTIQRYPTRPLGT
jgi:hypothetical protein